MPTEKYKQIRNGEGLPATTMSRWYFPSFLTFHHRVYPVFPLTHDPPDPAPTSRSKNYCPHVNCCISDSLNVVLIHSHIELNTKKQQKRYTVLKKTQQNHTSTQMQWTRQRPKNEHITPFTTAHLTANHQQTYTKTTTSRNWQLITTRERGSAVASTCMCARQLNVRRHIALIEGKETERLVPRTRFASVRMQNGANSAEQKSMHVIWVPALEIRDWRSEWMSWTIEMFTFDPRAQIRPRLDSTALSTNGTR